MKHTALIFGLVTSLGIACVPGANTQSASVSILDVDVVAKALGRDDVMQQQIRSAQQQLNEELTRVRDELKAQLTEKRSEIGEEPSQEQRESLQRSTADAVHQLEQTQQLALQRSAEVRAAVVNQFRDEIAPYAAEIARARGTKAVFTPAASMIWFEPEADITGEVIAAMRARATEPRKPAPEVTPAEEVEGDPAESGS